MGLVCLLLGIFKLGGLVRFLPYPPTWAEMFNTAMPGGSAAATMADWGKTMQR